MKRKVLSTVFIFTLFFSLFFPFVFGFNSKALLLVETPEWVVGQSTQQLGNKQIRLSFTINNLYTPPEGSSGPNPERVAIKQDSSLSDDQLNWITLDGVIINQVYSINLDYSSSNYSIGNSYTIAMMVDYPTNVFDLITFVLQQSTINSLSVISQGRTSATFEYVLVVNSGFGRVSYRTYEGDTPPTPEIGWTLDIQNANNLVSGTKTFQVLDLQQETSYNIQLRIENQPNTITLPLAFQTLDSATPILPSFTNLSILSKNNVLEIDYSLVIFSGDSLLTSIRIEYTISNNTTRNWIREDSDLVNGENIFTIDNTLFYLTPNTNLYLRFYVSDVLSTTSLSIVVPTVPPVISNLSTSIVNPTTTKVNFNFVQNNGSNILNYRFYVSGSTPPTIWETTSSLQDGLNSIDVVTTLNSLYIFEISDNPLETNNTRSIGFIPNFSSGTINNFIFSPAKTSVSFSFIFGLNQLLTSDVLTVLVIEELNPDDFLLYQTFNISNHSPIHYSFEVKDLTPGVDYRIQIALDSITTGLPVDQGFSTSASSLITGDIINVNQVNSTNVKISFDLTVNDGYSEIFYKFYQTNITTPPATFTLVKYYGTYFEIEFPVVWSRNYTFIVYVDDSSNILTQTFDAEIPNSPSFTTIPTYLYNSSIRELTINFSVDFSNSNLSPLIEFTYYGYNLNTIWYSYGSFPIGISTNTIIVKNVLPYNSFGNLIDVYLKIPYNGNTLRAVPI